MVEKVIEEHRAAGDIEAEGADATKRYLVDIFTSRGKLSGQRRRLSLSLCLFKMSKPYPPLSDTMFFAFPTYRTAIQNGRSARRLYRFQRAHGLEGTTCSCRRPPIWSHLSRPLLTP